MTFKDYQEPSADFLCSQKLHRRPVPKYDYILLDKGLIQPQYETTVEELQKVYKQNTFMSILVFIRGFVLTSSTGFGRIDTQEPR